ncbi:hypothetical protein WR25_23071 isoform C [Diploscapter pachys]|uniref:EF-hand domain-containing protein n=1 Tax=Diploscapter pachys TaxID=2018661 RepID=A0A2A2KZQ6_9BILA|nr:hypothetical protein WR25_23071 isoform A [Diploscapter pachys]PAV79325.1 hypothetical protein WR25_23071 isoform C [Diploscapter pachys]
MIGNNQQKFLKNDNFQFDRVLHQVYSEPERFTSRSCIDRILIRIYWGLRAAQFKIFYKNEELDVDDSTDKWEIGVQPPLLETLVQQTHFDPRWIKYMYSRFKNVCPTGRMREHEFRKVLSSIIAAEKATDQYITRLFVAFSQQDKQTLTFEDLLATLCALHPQSARTNAQWTLKLITGTDDLQFTFPDFLSFTQSVFSLNEGKSKKEDVNRETVYQRATTIFNVGFALLYLMDNLFPENVIQRLEKTLFFFIR